MPKAKPTGRQTCPGALQIALDALDVVGTWEWVAGADTVRVDGIVALLYNLDPEQAAAGIPLLCFIDSIHADDQERVLGLIRQSALTGGPYLAEYRVCSVDGRTRWVLARGRFTSDHAGRPAGGNGILVDITQMRRAEATAGAPVCEADPPLERAAVCMIAAQKAIAALHDPDLKALADVLLMSIGRKLALQEVHERRKSMN